MSTSAVSSGSLYSQLGQYFQTRQSDLQQLGQALQSGDLAGAQTVYNNIASLGQNGPFAGGNPFRSNRTEQEFANLGQALQSGDLAGAQQAFTSLESAGGRGNRQLDPPSTSPTPANTSGPEIIINLSPGSTAGTGSVSPSSTATIPTPASNGPEIILDLSPISSGGGGSASPEQITINLSSPAGGGEQVSIGIGSQGSTAEQVTFNLPANSNEQIILNLLGAAPSTGSSSSSTTTGGSTAGGGLNVSA